MTPIRIQRSRQHKQVSPNGLPIKYVGRPTKWGNPYRVVGRDGVWVVLWNRMAMFAFNDRKKAIGCCISLFRLYLIIEQMAGRLNLEELRGYNLSCWCPHDEPCHVDVLFEILNK